MQNSEAFLLSPVWICIHAALGEIDTGAVEDSNSLILIYKSNCFGKSIVESPRFDDWTWYFEALLFTSSWSFVSLLEFWNQ